MTATKPSDVVITSIKNSLQIPSEITVFDPVILIHINTVLSTLQQLGLGLTTEQFVVDGYEDTWADVLTSQKNLEMIKSYIYLRVKQLFDPPSTGFVTDSFDRQIKELEWRINVAASSEPNDSSS